MKKGKIFAMIGALIVLASFVVMGKERNLYEKKENFECVDQIIERIDNKVIQTRSNKNPFRGLAETDDFKECLSERYRIAGSDFYFTRVDIEEKLEMTDKEKQSIIAGYQGMSVNYKTDKKITLYDIVKYKAKFYYEDEYVNQGTNYLYMIIVDEGEGLVVDYFSTNINSITDYSDVTEIDENTDTTDSNTGE